MDGLGGLITMRQFDYDGANRWLKAEWERIKGRQYIECIKRCIEKEKVTDGNQ